jgi:hypothetical protein
VAGLVAAARARGAAGHIGDRGDIAGAIGRGLGLPVVSVPADRAAEHFGWLHKFCTADRAADSAATRTLLGWTPAGPGLMEDLDGGSHYG